MADFTDQSPDISFSARLQEVTERLAAALDRPQVFDGVLQPALAALGAVAGLIMLAGGGHLRMAARQGYDAAMRLVWQDGPLDAPGPAADALRRREPLYFEDSGALLAAYPELEAQTGGQAAVACAVLPIVLHGQGLGVLVLDFREPHLFSAEARRFLLTLAAQIAIALDRVRAFEQEQAARQALQASEQRFRKMVMASPTPVAVGGPGGHLLMANDAYLELLEYSRAEFEAGEVGGRQLTPPGEHAEHIAAHGPLLDQGGSPSYLKTLLTRSGRRLTARVRLLPFEDQGRRLVICYLEDLTEQLQREQNLQALVDGRTADLRDRTGELEARTAALDAFVAYTEAVGAETDPLALARLATQVLQASLNQASTTYYELEDHLWRAKLMSEDVESDIAGQLQAGISAEAPSFALAHTTEDAVFVDGWDAGGDGIEGGGAYGAVALIPLRTAPPTERLFTVGIRAGRAWQPHERALVRAVGRGLTLALERSEQARVLAQRNSELSARSRALEARTRTLEAFADLAGRLGQDVSIAELIGRTQEVVLGLLPMGHALYWEPSGRRWCLRSQRGELGSTDLQTALDQGLPLGSVPSLDRPWSSLEGLYEDRYAAGQDLAPALTGQVQSLAVLPVWVDGVPSGLLSVATLEPHAWSAEDRTVLQAVVQSLGSAIERAQGIIALAARSADLERSNAALQAANEELEAFTYSVSHDLMTPVRHVTSFSELAQQSLQDPAKTRRYLGIIDQGARRMHTLIEAMLQLARSGRLELQLEALDLSALVARAQLDLADELQGRQLTWEVAALPLVTADRETLQQAVTNLLSNAVKFTRARPQARVRVWAEDSEAGRTLFVQDNGVGFDPRYRDKLFGIFQRLHRQEEFEGTGVGLANVRRILTRHGGSVHAEGQPDGGATFSITLPRRG